jgi:hypothetical protein
MQKQTVGSPLLYLGDAIPRSRKPSRHDGKVEILAELGRGVRLLRRALSTARLVLWWLGTVAVSYALVNHACSNGATAACEALARFQFLFLY